MRPASVFRMDPSCAVCDTALVRGDGRPPHDVDIERTSHALQERVQGGHMTFLRGDVALEDMLTLAASDAKYTIVAFLRCEECHRVRFWGLCIRGAPTYKIVDADAPARWPWEPVPPREIWA